VIRPEPMVEFVEPFSYSGALVGLHRCSAIRR
jgi:hypothetical protein